jgi:hypothetical protein
VPCSYAADEGFGEWSSKDDTLLGECVTNSLGDRFGNTRQYTRKGVLFWQKGTNNVYFFKGGTLWEPVDGKSTTRVGTGLD